MSLTNTSQENAVTVNNVSIYYKLYNNAEDRLKEALHPFRKLYHKKFYALKDVNLTVKKGSVLGIVGRNGSGKSTLLKIIAGVLTPSSGWITAQGRISALLELSAGFNPEINGLQNIYFFGSILGFSKSQMDKKIDGIVSFADIGEFIYQPIKTYSSGMRARLAFAVSISVDPDILIIDEVMAVGDAPFRAKCFARMRRLINSGVSILFVSHSIENIRNFCTHAIYLNKGNIIAKGDCKYVCDLYEADCRKAQGLLDNKFGLKEENKSEEMNLIADDFNPQNHNFPKYANIQREGNKSAEIIDFYISDLTNNILENVNFNETVKLNALIKFNRDIEGVLHHGMDVKTIHGIRVSNYTDPHYNESKLYKKGTIVKLSASLKFPLSSGKYYITSGITIFPPDKKFVDGSIDFSKAQILDLIEYAYYFSVLIYKKHSIRGPVTFHINHDIKVKY